MVGAQTHVSKKVQLEFVDDASDKRKFDVGFLKINSFQRSWRT